MCPLQAPPSSRPPLPTPSLRSTSATSTTTTCSTPTPTVPAPWPAETWEFTATSVASSVAGHHDNLATAKGFFQNLPITDTDPGCYNIEVKADVTRTLGFWQTHTTFTEKIFTDELDSSITIGNKVINSSDALFSGFYSGISRDSEGAKRSPDDQCG